MGGPPADAQHGVDAGVAGCGAKGVVTRVILFGEGGGRASRGGQGKDLYAHVLLQGAKAVGLVHKALYTQRRDWTRLLSLMPFKLLCGRVQHVPSL